MPLGIPRCAVEVIETLSNSLARMSGERLIRIVPVIFIWARRMARGSYHVVF